MKAPIAHPELLKIRQYVSEHGSISLVAEKPGISDSGLIDLGFRV